MDTTNKRNKFRRFMPSDRTPTGAQEDLGQSGVDGEGLLAGTDFSGRPKSFLRRFALGRRQRTIQFLTVAGIGLLLLLWLGPAIVAHSPLRNRVLLEAIPDLKGTLTAESASLGWFSPVVLHDVRLRDKEDRPVAEAASLEGETSLLSLIFDRQHLGKFRLVEPELILSIDEKGSNVEDVFAAWLDPEKAQSLDCPSVDLAIVDGKLTIDDVPHKRHWQVEELNVDLFLAHNWSQPLEATLSGSMPQPDRAATLDGKLEMTRTAGEKDGIESAGRLNLKTGGLPLSLVEPFLRRTAPEARVGGWLSSTLDVAWQTGEARKAKLEINGEIDAEQLSLSGPPLRDELRLKRAKLPLKAALNGDSLVIEKLSLQCDVGQAALNGTLEVPLAEGTLPGLLAALSDQSYEITGQLDLATLAKVLPETIRIREGTQITAGTVNVQLARKSEASSSKWNGKVQTSNLVAVNQGKQVTWQNPMQALFEAHDGPAGPVIDKLTCDSSFMHVEAAGTLDYLDVSVDYDLKLLAAQLNQFLDLGGMELAGDGWTYLTWKKDANGRFEADGEMQIQKFRLVASDGRAWQEQNLVVKATGAGSMENRRISQVTAATFKVDSGPDHLTARLLKPISSLEEGTAWPMDFKLSGQLATWQPRLEPWAGDLSHWDLSGKCDIQAMGSVSAEEFAIGQSSGTIADFEAIGPSLHVVEPNVGLQAKGRFGRLEQRAEISQAVFTSSAFSLDASNVTIDWPQGEVPQLEGTVTYSGDVHRMQRWLPVDPANPPKWEFAGRLQGRLHLAPVGDSVTGELDTQIDNLVATRPDTQPWREAKIRLIGDGRFDRPADRLTMHRFQLVSAMLKCDASGQIADLKGRRDMQLTGNLEYETQRLFELLKPYIGEGVEVVAGRESRPFSLSGPLAALAKANVPPPTNDRRRRGDPAVEPWFQEYAGEASLGWTGANVYGFRLASGELRSKLLDGLLTVNPLSLSVSEGRLTAAPRLRLWPEPAEMTLDKGPLLTQVRISPEMCQRGLKYIAPILADVAEAEGKFSIAMEGCRLPIGAPGTGEAAGTMTVHAVDIGPGALTKELAVLLDRPGGVAKLKREAVVPFRMVEGRVYHRDLELVFPDVTIRTYGSVGLDQTLSIMAEMPVPPKWIGSNPLGAGMKNQIIKLPIGGTLQNPKIDAKALAQVSSEFLKKGAQNLLFENLDKQFNRFLGPGEKKD